VHLQADLAHACIALYVRDPVGRETRRRCGWASAAHMLNGLGPTAAYLASCWGAGRLRLGAGVLAANVTWLLYFGTY